MENQLLNKSKLLCPERLAEIIARREKIGPVGIVCNNCTAEGYTVGWVNVYQGQKSDIDVEQLLRDEEELLAHIAAMEEHKELRALLILQELNQEEDDDVLMWVRYYTRNGRFDSSLQEIIADDGVRTAKDIICEVRAFIRYQSPQRGGERA
ncbi:hypothetical protein JJB07_14720 [Tumebacillus sp. ITR2]|uniref:Uncharacterized protein n=1 Tax=Tumebacillus amylolyticus TaxID=2801339 RepID=A0ABS1JC95_9BACL|nr:hypothetical protein [Tumebacillus amylolyticus]MBL0387892.1 hypothetical protein [Tumebacillus amylolyticus]